MLDHRKSKGIPKKSTFASLTMLKPLTVWITENCEKFLKKWEYQITLSPSWETYMQVKKQQLELDMEWWTGSKLGKEYVKDVLSEQFFLLIYFILLSHHSFYVNVFFFKLDKKFLDVRGHPSMLLCFYLETGTGWTLQQGTCLLQDSHQ